MIGIRFIIGQMHCTIWLKELKKAILKRAIAKIKIYKFDSMNNYFGLCNDIITPRWVTSIVLTIDEYNYPFFKRIINI